MNVISRFQPFARDAFRPALGQDDTIITTYDQNQTTQEVPNLITSYDQGQASPVPGLVTSLDQQAPVVPTQKPAGMSDTDWAKLLASALTAASSGYATYSKEEIARINSQAAALKAKNPAAGAILPSTGGVSSNTLFVIGGLALAGIVLATALR